MNRSIISTAISLVAIIIAMFIVISVFSKEGNSIGEIFIYLTSGALILAWSKPKVGLYAIVIASTFMDTVKRLMVLDLSVTSDDIAAVQAFCPAIAVGVIIATMVHFIKNRRGFGEIQTKVFIIAQALAILIGIGYLLSGGTSAESVGNVLNASVYISLLGCLPKYFHKPQECVQFFKFLALVYIPVALWAIKQGIWGIADFEMQYLLSGLTVEIRQLGENVFRNMGTLSGAPAMSYTASILAAAMLIPFSWSQRRWTVAATINPFRFVFFVIFVVAAYYTYSRTGWVIGVLAVCIFMVIRSQLMTYISAAAGACSLALLIIFAQDIIDADFLNETQNQLKQEVSQSDQGDQVLVLGTVNGRLESLANLTNNPDTWTPFGLKVSSIVSGQTVNFVHAHDAITEFVVLVGYVPLILILIIAPITMNRFYLIYMRLPASDAKMTASYFFSLGIGICLVSLGQLKSMFTFPVNLFWCFFLGFGICCYIFAVSQRDEKFDKQ